MPQILIFLFLAACALLCGFICGSIKGCNDSATNKVKVRMEEREQIERLKQEEREQSERLKQEERDRALREILEAQERRDRHVAELSSRQSLLSEAASTKAREEERNADLRMFVMREAPSVWSTFETLRGEVVSVSAAVADYRKRLEARGGDLYGDAELVRLKTIRNAMVRKQKEMEAKLDAAYMESLRAEITPGGSAMSDGTRRDLMDSESGMREVLDRYREIGGGR